MPAPHQQGTELRGASRPSDPPLAQRPVRADARRSREAIIAAFERLTVERGADVAMYEVARAAGLGQGTLYRHFPTRSVLVAEVFERIIDHLGLDAGEADDPGRFLRMLTAALRSQVRTHGLTRALRDAQDGMRLLERLTRRAVEAFEEPLAAARAAGVVREDLTTDDVLTMMAMLDGVISSLVALKRRDEAAERAIELLLEGVLVDGSEPPG
ncbi:TetR/AcrR family transcriptional regulator [Cellulomonas sp. KRMCY2]|uniref:TetR/AcrR family transcriptional regulator n=1 Tax=Cellulomonas sp. KRMCY2 TaxID=1304865 RepID=UPI00045E7E46|nr:TetR/AcrR family transcriptional regulator [Cellulomonas sp. KRMCY2]